MGEPSKKLYLNVSLDEHYATLMKASARDQYTTPHQHARTIIQCYLDGYQGPYVLKLPLKTHEGQG